MGRRGSHFPSASILHTEYYQETANRLDIGYDQELIERTFTQSGLYFSGKSDHMDEDVARFQAIMFEEDAIWTEKINEEYKIDSIVFETQAKKLKRLADDIRSSNSIKKKESVSSKH